MSVTLVNKTSIFLLNYLMKTRPGVADMVRFRKTDVPCWRCVGQLEAHCCEDGVYALRCDGGCPGVFIVRAGSPKDAADEIAGSYVGEIPGGGVPGC